MEENIAINNRQLFSNYLNLQSNADIVNTNQLTRIILDEICDFVVPGVKESEVLQYTDLVFKQHKIDRIWHKPEVRFGDNTTLTYLDRSKKDNQLQTQDIAFIDIGIVINGIEGDAGKTLVFGDNALHQDIAIATKELFHEARNFWLEQSPTGIELYSYLIQRAKVRGYICNLNPAGHLIGSFSHATAKWKYGLNEYPDRIEACRWILEVQIRHPQLNVGGFFEDLLI